jgi:hypothetical protein
MGCRLITETLFIHFSNQHYKIKFPQILTKLFTVLPQALSCLLEIYVIICTFPCWCKTFCIKNKQQKIFGNISIFHVFFYNIRKCMPLCLEETWNFPFCLILFLIHKNIFDYTFDRRMIPQIQQWLRPQI